MAVTASMVKELRERTGAGMMECKKALVETNGDMDAAIEFLRKTGLAQADKKASRVAAEGVVMMASSEGNNEAVMVEINSIVSEGPDQKNVDKVKESQRREREINIQKNGYWLNSLAVYYREGRELSDFMKFNELIEGFSAEAAHAAAAKYFDTDNMIQVTLYPED